MIRRALAMVLILAGTLVVVIGSGRRIGEPTPGAQPDVVLLVAGTIAMLAGLVLLMTDHDGTERP